MIFELLTGVQTVAGGGGGGGGGGAERYAASLYTGTGAARTIANGVNLQDNGGMVMFKRRAAVEDFAIFDSPRSWIRRSRPNSGVPDDIVSALSPATTGFVLSGANYNALGETYVAWALRNLTGFFKAQAFTGGVSLVSHGLGATPGFIMVMKRTTRGSPYDGQEHGLFWHRDMVLGEANRIGQSNPDSFVAYIDNVGASQFRLQGAYWGATDTYIAYSFGHDDDLVSCGSYTGSKSAGDATEQTVTLPFAPSMVMVFTKQFGNAHAIYDVVRGADLFLSETAGEGGEGVRLSGTDLLVKNDAATRQFALSGETFYYVALR